MRIRMTFAKTSAMRYTGNLDLHRALERLFRRGKLPLAYSQGFTPRPKINLAAALPLGMTSTCELADFWLEHEMPLDEVARGIHKASPPGIQLKHLEVIPQDAPKLQNRVRQAWFSAAILSPITDLDGKIEGLLAAESLTRQRRKKTYDLRPLVLSLKRLEDRADGAQQVCMHLLAREGATGRADEVLDALGCDALDAEYERTALELE